MQASKKTRTFEPPDVLVTVFERRDHWLIEDDPQDSMALWTSFAMRRDIRETGMGVG